MDLLETPIGNDSGFYSTFCIVCRSTAELKRCSKCKMIGYCCSEHQKTHWPKHKQICAAIYRARTVGGVPLPGHDKDVNLANDGYYPQQVWTDQITTLQTVIEMGMQRQLDTDERSMILFPRSCRVCRDMDYNKLFCCDSCCAISYCSETHCKTDFSRHAKDCDHLAFSFQIAQFSNKTGGNLQPPCLYFPLRYKYCLLPMNIHSYMKPKDDMGNSIEDKILRAIAFGGHSNPLTLLYAMENTGFLLSKKTLIVHIVGPNQEECVECIYWEDVLHWLPELKELNLILVGPNAVKFYKSCFMPLCDDCTNLERSLCVTIHTMLYHEYFRLDSFVKPDIVAAYNCGFNEFEGASNDTWTASLPLLVNPWLVFTSFNSQDAVRDLQCVKNACKKPVKVVFDIQENPFRRTQPYREFECDTVFFRNYFLTVLKME